MRHGPLLELGRDVQAIAAAEIADGERVLWAQQPVARLLARGPVMIVLVGLIWIAAVSPIVLLAFFDRHSLFDGAMTVEGPTGTAGKVFSILMLSVGVACLSAPYLHRRSMRRKAYVITDRRALVVFLGTFGRPHVQQFAPDRVAQMKRTDRRDGSGDLVFEVITTTSGSGTYTERRGFLAVADVVGVEALLRRTLLEGRTRDA